ncbi:prepilin-type N-terminal cleavage/methylation domain-containing protein [Thermodesulfovibrionales bacterium]|nr:prepilin-type N-terminal cleavage/methylation domain-containing protein [Thermodesulfovibrionales bacterium]
MNTDSSGRIASYKYAKSAKCYNFITKFFILKYRQHTRSVSGFTLLEVLIAVTLSAIILAGLYTALNSVLVTEESLNRKNEEMKVYVRLANLFQKDLRTMQGSKGIKVERGVHSAIITFKTTNTLPLNSSMPVTVRYYLDLKNGRKYLVREEVKEAKGMETTIRLLGGIEDLEFFFLERGEWVEWPDEEGCLTVVKMKFRQEGRAWQITGGRIGAQYF